MSVKVELKKTEKMPLWILDSLNLNDGRMSLKPQEMSGLMIKNCESGAA